MYYIQDSRYAGYEVTKQLVTVKLIELWILEVRTIN